jgi:hypothetical protein
VRTDVTVADVFALIHGPVAALGHHGADRGARERIFGIVCDGLRARSGEASRRVEEPAARRPRKKELAP